jgi:rod shape determining protein RodA
MLVDKKVQSKNIYPKKRSFYAKIRLDWPLFIGIIAISSLGILILYSAKPELSTIQRQIIHLVLAYGLMMTVAQLPPRFLRGLAPWLYFITLGLLVTVLVMGHISKGAQRWLDLWFFRFQPAELMKIAVPLIVARYLHVQLLPPKLYKLFIPFILIIIPVILTAKQPDLGTALLILMSGLFVIFFAGIPWNTLLTLFGITAASIPAFWFFMRDYQKQRILVLFNPEHDPLGTGYHIIQSKIAIGSGGAYGKGWLNGSQSHLEFLPERTTDFVFAVFSEEFGLVGCLFMLSLYLYVIFRGLYISTQAQDTFTRLLAGSLVMSLFVYVFVNVGMVTGILPVVGIPLPLVSYGGTSLVTLMFSFGILMSIHKHRRLIYR